MNNTMVGVDLAKEVIQVCTCTNKKVRSNVEMTHHEFLRMPEIFVCEFTYF